MSLKRRIGSWFRPIIYLGRNPVTLTGAVLTTGSAVSIIAFWLWEVFLVGARVSPYADIVAYLILPAIFVIGLVMIPAGLLLRRFRLKRRGELPEEYPSVDFAQPLLRRALVLVAAATLLNVLILSTASYEGVQYMDSVRFCGAACHTVMQPEYTAFQHSPHSHVACVDCHIGPGAKWFFRSKLAGVKRVFAVAFHDYPTPIPSPLEEMRPAVGTCDHCHSPQKFTGKVLVVKHTFSPDKDNTSLASVLMMNVGGPTPKGPVGIHGHHLQAGATITYVSTDPKHQVIPEVIYTDPSGKTTVYRTKDKKVTAAEIATGARRQMDCMDCHNRAGHTFHEPGIAVDDALHTGAIAADLPFIKKESVAVLKKTYKSRDEGTKQIADSLHAYYEKNYPKIAAAKKSELTSAVTQVQEIYLRNVFPKMKVTWGTYPNNLSHAGCFRCHDGKHVSPAGKAISKDCAVCHQPLAMGEHEPDILDELGLK